MRRAATFILLVFACHQLCALPEHSVSPSRQFVIYGADARLRGAISELAEQTKTNLLALLRQRDEWKTAVVINLRPQQANLPEIPDQLTSQPDRIRREAATRFDRWPKFRRFIRSTAAPARHSSRDDLSTRG